MLLKERIAALFDTPPYFEQPAYQKAERAFQRRMDFFARLDVACTLAAILLAVVDWCVPMGPWVPFLAVLALTFVVEALIANVAAMKVRMRFTKMEARVAARESRRWIAGMKAMQGGHGP
jgi:hypothetical protein